LIANVDGSNAASSPGTNKHNTHTIHSIHHLFLDPFFHLTYLYSIYSTE